MTGFDRREILTGLGMAALTPSLAWSQTATGPALLPKGMTKANFSAALGALRSIVGAEWVFADETAITPYKDAMIPDVGGKHVPIGAVAPSTVEQVQQIVEVANRYKMPLWPVSTGKNTRQIPGRRLAALSWVSRARALVQLIDRRRAERAPRLAFQA
jgi:4-cresol dehydrogenase (hydroxylating)